MASFKYDHFLYLLGKAGIDFSTDDIRALLVMTNTTANIERDAAVIADFTLLDEYDGATYARKALTGEAWTEDNTNHRGKFDANDVDFGATLGIGTRQAKAVIIFKFVTTDADHIPLFYIDTGGFPKDGNGGAFPITWAAAGIDYIA